MSEEIFKNAGKTDLIHLALSGLLILSLGLTSGYSFGYFQAKKASFPSIREVADVNENVSTIKFMKVQNGFLKGQIDGRRTRLAYSPDDIMDLEPGASFEIPLNKVTLWQYYSASELPSGVAYIASTSGKYYYSILDPRALKITPKNRIYFNDSNEAENRGFKAPK